MLVLLFEPQKTAEAAMAQAAVGSTMPTSKPPFPWGRLALIAAVTLFSSMLYYVFIINGALIFREVGVTEPHHYAAVIFIPQFFILAGAGLFKFFSDRSHRLQLGVFLLLMGLGLSGMGVASTVGTMVAALVIQQTAAGMAVPALISWTQTKFDYHHRGTGMGVWTAAFFLGQSQSPRLVHLIDAQVGSMQGAFLVAGSVGLAGAAVALLLRLTERPRVARA